MATSSGDHLLNAALAFANVAAMAAGPLGAGLVACFTSLIEGYESDGSGESMETAINDAVKKQLEQQKANDTRNQIQSIASWYLRNIYAWKIIPNIEDVIKGNIDQTTKNNFSVFCQTLDNNATGAHKSLAVELSNLFDKSLSAPPPNTNTESFNLFMYTCTLQLNMITTLLRIYSMQGSSDSTIQKSASYISVLGQNIKNAQATNDQINKLITARENEVKLLHEVPAEKMIPAFIPDLLPFAKEIMPLVTKKEDILYYTVLDFYMHEQFKKLQAELLAKHALEFNLPEVKEIVSQRLEKFVKEFPGAIPYHFPINEKQNAENKLKELKTLAQGYKEKDLNYDPVKTANLMQKLTETKSKLAKNIPNHSNN